MLPYLEIIYKLDIPRANCYRMSDPNQLIKLLAQATAALEAQTLNAESEKPTPLSSDDEEETTVDYYASYAQKYIDFTYENPTIYHVVRYFRSILEDNGFTYLPENKSWPSLDAGKYYTVRNGTSLLAFAIGSKWTPEDGVGLIGSHIDVLTTKLKPCLKKPSLEGFELLGVAPYAGALSEMWWDRDLHIGGKVLIRTLDGRVTTRLIKSEHPVARIPTLAPHFGIPFEKLTNKETRAVPVIAYNGEAEEEALTEEEKTSPLAEAHLPTLLRFVAELAGAKVQDLVQLDLDIYEGQKGAIGGIKKDFLFAPRIDDRICGFTAIHALLEHLKNGVSDNEFSIVTLYDNEEIGSLSRQGARGGLSESVVSRTIDSFLDKKKYTSSLETLYKLAYANSLFLSADVNHAFNPNFSDVYLENHRPKLNTGMTIAFDEHAFATDVTGRAVIEEVARKNGDKLQMFHIRNDSRSGGTIGPYISSKTGARVIDCGIAQWSMHSSRATVGSKDVGLGVKFFRGFFDYWRESVEEFDDY